MTWNKYGSSVEDYLQLDNRYDVRFEYRDGTISLRDGTPVILIGRAPADKTFPEKAMVVIADATEEEVQKLVAFVASLRSKEDKES